MKSKWISLGAVVTAIALAACARAAPLSEEDQDVTGAPAADAAPAPSTTTPTTRDSSVPPTDSSTTNPAADAASTDAGRDSTPPPPPPPPDSSTGGPPTCTADVLNIFRAGNQTDKPPCDSTCRGCCWTTFPLAPPEFCLRP